MTVLSVIMGLLTEYLDKFLVKVLTFEITYDIAVGTDEKCAGNECDVIATRLTVVSGIIQYASRLVGRCILKHKDIIIVLHVVRFHILLPDIDIIV